MTVKELIEELKKIPQGDKVFLVIDDEENGYRQPSLISGGNFFIVENRDYVVYPGKWGYEDTHFTKEEWEEVKRNPENQCVLIK